jgi:hypothetical protein
MTITPSATGGGSLRGALAQTLWDSLHGVRLLNAGNMSRQWQLKIKGEANPFDPKWRAHFEQWAKGSTARSLRKGHIQASQKLVRMFLPSTHWGT